MKAMFIMWMASVCLLEIVPVNSEEQCDIYGALVEKPGRQCICDQRGVVRCKPRIGGRFLVCIIDLSQLGSNVNEIFTTIAKQKRTFRDWVLGGESQKQEQEKIDPDFDPPDFTMTIRPTILGGIGQDEVDFGKHVVEIDEIGDYGDLGEGDGGYDGGGVVGGGGDDLGGGDIAGGGGTVVGNDAGEGDAERFRRMRHQVMKTVPRVSLKSRPRKTALANAKPRSMFPSRKKTVPKNNTKPRTMKTPVRPNHFRAQDHTLKNKTGAHSHNTTKPIGAMRKTPNSVHTVAKTKDVKRKRGEK